MGHLINGTVVVTPTASDAALAKESGKQLAAHLGDLKGVRLKMKTGKKSEELVLPPSALRLLIWALTELAQGNAVTLTPHRAQLTTQQAADLLNVSRPHLVKLLDEKAIPSHKVGSHRRVRLTDLLTYKAEMLAKRHAALDELTALSQELDMGY
jgi:excisionase family DNA binding protein